MLHCGDLSMPLETRSVMRGGRDLDGGFAAPLLHTRRGVGYILSEWP
jgi:hypothetical protein